MLARREGSVYLCPESGTRRRGLWRLPEISLEVSADWEELFRFDYAITRYRVSLSVCVGPATWDPPEDGGGWFQSGSEEALPPLGAPYRKALRLAREGCSGAADGRRNRGR